MKHLFILFGYIILFLDINTVRCKNVIPYLNLMPAVRFVSENTTEARVNRKPRAFGPKSNDFLPFDMLIDKDKDRDTSEYWREAEILSLIRNREADIDYERCEQTPQSSIVHIPTRRTVRPICRSSIDHQLCPQCSHFNNHTECELFQDSCKERKVKPSECRQYCDRKYGKFRTMFIPADYSQCRCCDECIPYREIDQSCMEDEYSFDTDEFLPVTTIDFRAGCNPYWGHPEQELKALKCDQMLRRCVPVNIPTLSNETIIHIIRNKYRFKPITVRSDCPISCRGYNCYGGLVNEKQCPPGAFIPHKDQCNCCGSCSVYYQLNQECAHFKKTVRVVNSTTETEVRPQIEEEFLEPGCDDGLVCRQGICQDIHTIGVDTSNRRKRDEGQHPNELNQECAHFKKTVRVVNSTTETEVRPQIEEEFLEPGCDDGLVCRQGICQDIHTIGVDTSNRRKRDEGQHPNEPCKMEMKYFKKKYGDEGHLHYDAPQCTPLWLYAPVQCRRFVCYCALEDGTFIEGIKVPRVEVSNMNCDCAREKCRTAADDFECDGYGNYKDAIFTPHFDEWFDKNREGVKQLPGRTTRQMSVTTHMPPTTTTEL